MKRNTILYETSAEFVKLLLSFFTSQFQLQVPPRKNFGQLQLSRISGVVGKKVGAAGSCNFPTEKITGTRNFNFALKRCQNGSFWPQILHF